MKSHLLLTSGDDLNLVDGHSVLLLELQDTHGRDSHAVASRYGDSHAVTHPGVVGSVSVEVQ